MAFEPIFSTPINLQPLFGGEAILRRVVTASQWGESSKLLVLADAHSALMLAGMVGCDVLLAHDHADICKEAESIAAKEGWSDCFKTVKVDYANLEFGAATFDGVLSISSLLSTLNDALLTYRRWLREFGRVAIVSPVKVGRQESKKAQQFWEKRLERPVPSMRELLQLVETFAYEPELTQSSNEEELDGYYERVLKATKAKFYKEEAEAFKTQNHGVFVSMGLVVARRKEAGEPPPVSRDRG